ncbi:MAG: replication initiator protein A [Pseudomonadota bacterium]
MAQSLQDGAGGTGLARGQGDFFLCDILDAIPKDDVATMEHPVFSLATRPDRRILTYAHNGTEITVTPSVRGLATIHDKDILIYCISQLMAAQNAGRPVARRLRLTAHDLLLATGRETSGDAYQRLRDALERLAGTRITTNIAQGGFDLTEGFGLIEGWQILRQSRQGRMIAVSVTLSDWLFRAVLSKSVLTLSRDYFRLRRPLERRLYELARKHCGRQPEWRISVDTLLKKSGSASPRRVFRAMLREVIAADTIPDYVLAEEPGDILRVTPRAVVIEPHAGPHASPEALDEARRLAPGADVHALQADWRAFWARSGRPRLRSPDAAFLGFVQRGRG